MQKRIFGHEDRMLRDRIVGLVNRKQGQIEGPGAACSTVDLQAQYELLANIDRLSPMYFTNSDQTVWSPQNTDGSFAYLPGFDGPLS